MQTLYRELLRLSRRYDAAPQLKGLLIQATPLEAWDHAQDCWIPRRSPTELDKHIALLFGG